MSDLQRVVTVLPGVPDMEGLSVDGQTPYPDSTQDFVKVLREHGLQAEFRDGRSERRYVTHKAYEAWLPIVQFGFDVLMAFQAGILADLLKDYLFGGSGADDGDERTGPAILHVDWRVTSSSGDERRIVANGRPEAVLEALDKFDREVREG